MSRRGQRLVPPAGILAALATLLALSFALTAGASPAAARFELDVDSSLVRFTLGATAHTVHGTGRIVRGHLDLDTDGKASGEVLVDARSFDTESKRRDRKMHDTVLESAEHPDIVLQIREIEGTIPVSGEGAVEIEGVLQIHGETHDVRIPVFLKMSGDGFTATAEMEVPYVSWGMKDPSGFFLRVDKSVDVTVELVGRARR